FQVSQRDATEKLADQVPTETFAAYRRLEKTSGDTHAQEKDETHKSSKGHVSEPAVACHISHECLRERETPPTAEMNTYQETEKSCSPSLPNLQTKVQHKTRRDSEFSVKMRDLPERSRPPTNIWTLALTRISSAFSQRFITVHCV
ncbi:hypothetical protein IRJ41_000389, partial [Triplophysa rosa]